jgi:hypothetical protein
MCAGLGYAPINIVIKTLIVSLKEEHTETYYVVAEDQMLGPFDKRTITGMRVRKTLFNDSLICDSQGNYTTVVELLGNPLPLGPSSGGSDTSGSYHPHFAVTLLKPHVRDYAGLELRGEGEVRILSDVVRVAASVKRSLWGKAEPERVRVPHWHLELWFDSDEVQIRRGSQRVFRSGSSNHAMALVTGKAFMSASKGSRPL